MVAELVDEWDLSNLRPLVAAISGQVGVDWRSLSSVKILAVVADCHDEADSRLLRVRWSEEVLVVRVHVKMQGALLVLEAVDAPAVDVLERCVDQTPGEALVVGAVRLDLAFEVGEVLEAVVGRLHAVLLGHLPLVGGRKIVRHSVLHVKLYLVLDDVLLGQGSESASCMLKLLNIWVTMLDVVAVGKEGAVE